MKPYVSPSIDAARLPLTDLQAAKLGIAAAFLLTNGYSLGAIDQEEDEAPPAYLARINHNGVPVGYIERSGDDKLLANPTSYGLSFMMDWKAIAASTSWPTVPPLYAAPEGPTWKPIKKGSLPPIGISVLVAIGEHLTVGSLSADLHRDQPPTTNMILDCPPSPSSLDGAEQWYWMPLPDPAK